MYFLRRAAFLMFLCVGFAGMIASAQSGNADADKLFNTARSFITAGDYSNAVLVLNRAIELEPQNLEFRKQLAFTYYLQHDLDKADDIIKTLLKRDDADVQTYQIAGDILQARRDLKGAEKNYDRGIRKFPNSGELHNEMGLLYFNERKYTDALKYWIKGIEVAPAYAANYYNAARTYFYSNDKFWAILYGEIFINLERNSTRTAEMRGILLESYKSLFNNPDALSPALPSLDGSKKSGQDDIPDFRHAVLNTIAKSSSVVMHGVTPDALIMLRTRFILEWRRFYKLYYPYALFDFQQQLLKNGLFEAYNQWIFGPAANQANYRTWTQLHKEDYDRLMQYFQQTPLQPKAGEFYQKDKIDYQPLQQ